MNKFENFIYLSICELTLPIFKKTKFITYINYCRSMHKSIIDNDLTISERSDLIMIIDNLKLIYNLTDSESISYLINYFNSDKVIEMQKLIMLTREYFPITGDLDN